MKCLECGHDLVEMRRELIGFTVDSPKIEADLPTNWSYSYTEYAGHCTNCLSDWEWGELFEFGKCTVYQPKRIFWG